MFRVFAFIIGIVFGILLITLYKEQKHTIIDYPKPFDNTIYTDNNGMKFQYITKEVDCDKNEGTLKIYPIQ